MSAARKEVLLHAAQQLKISVDQADATAVLLLALLIEEDADGGAIIIRNKAAKTERLLVSERKLDLHKLAAIALRLERGEPL